MSNIKIWENLPPIADSPPAKASYSAELVKDYVDEKHQFKDMPALAEYLSSHRCPDYMSVGGIFYEMEEYDDAGLLVTYANVMYQREIWVSWDDKKSRYSDSPQVDYIGMRELTATRNDLQYKSKMPKE